MKKILITGSNGQLGSKIKYLVANDEIEVIKKEYNSKLKTQNSKFFFTDKEELDITDKETFRKFIYKNNIDLVINCAAYTAVDKAQEEKELAFKINVEAVKNLAQIAKEKNIVLIHISTDYVFDGKNYKPYIESDMANPINYYGFTKLEGEKAILKINPKNSIIIRTSWLYSGYKSNFLKTILNLGKTREKLNIVFDQIGTPTYTKDLAKAILDIIPQITNNKYANTQIYHYSNEGVCSWYDFAKEIINITNLDCQIFPILSKDYPTPAKRPHYSVLNKEKIKKDFGITISHWRESLITCLDTLGEIK